MDFVKQLERIKYIDFLITSQCASCPDSLSKKLNLTKRQLTNLVKIMKELGAPIEYNKRSKKYQYKENLFFFYGYKAKGN
ncbi:MAG: hypothetical protein ACK5QC_01170 [Bacteroidota bacterium]|jgi:hypothetical protein